MPQPSRGDLHVSRPLTNISVAFMQDTTQYIADQVFPRVPVSKQADQYFTYDMEQWFREEVKERAPGAESVGSGWTMSTDTYFARVYAFHKDIDDQTAANVDDPINLDADATRFVTGQMLLKRERLFIEKYLTTGIWAREITGVAAAPGANQFLQWDQASSTPIQDVQAERLRMQERTGYMPNVLVLGPYVELELVNHPDIIDRIKYTQRGFVSRDLLASAFGVDRVLVPAAIENTAAHGATGAYQFLHGKSAVLMYANPTPSLMQPSAGYIFTWTGYMGASAFGSRIKRFRIEPRASERIEAEMAFDMKVVSDQLGTFFASAVA